MSEKFFFSFRKRRDRMKEGLWFFSLDINFNRVIWARFLARRILNAMKEIGKYVDIYQFNMFFSIFWTVFFLSLSHIFINTCLICFVWDILIEFQYWWCRDEVERSGENKITLSYSPPPLTAVENTKILFWLRFYTKGCQMNGNVMFTIEIWEFFINFFLNFSSSWNVAYEMVRNDVKIAGILSRIVEKNVKIRWTLKARNFYSI